MDTSQLDFTELYFAMSHVKVHVQLMFFFFKYRVSTNSIAKMGNKKMITIVTIAFCLLLLAVSKNDMIYSRLSYSPEPPRSA